MCDLFVPEGFCFSLSQDLNSTLAAECRQAKELSPSAKARGAKLVRASRPEIGALGSSANLPDFLKPYCALCFAFSCIQGTLVAFFRVYKRVFLAGDGFFCPMRDGIFL